MLHQTRNVGGTLKTRWVVLFFVWALSRFVFWWLLLFPAVNCYKQWDGWPPGVYSHAKTHSLKILYVVHAASTVPRWIMETLTKITQHVPLKVSRVRLKTDVVGKLDIAIGKNSDHSWSSKWWRRTLTRRRNVEEEERESVAQARALALTKSQHDHRAWSANGWVTVVGFPPALRFLRSQILCRLQKSFGWDHKPQSTVLWKKVTYAR